MALGPGTAWLLLVLAGLLEIVWAVALKQADGLTRFWPSVVGITTMLVSVGLLTWVLRVLPVGTAYAVWVGIGAAGVAAAGMILFGESATIPRLICLTLIVAGVIGLHVLD